MIDREKVIKGLEYHLSEITIGKKCFQCPYFGDNPCEQILIASALELLKEQEPIEPKRTVDEHGQVLSCGNCGEWFEVQSQKYCHECGRAVKWDE